MTKPPTHSKLIGSTSLPLSLVSSSSKNELHGSGTTFSGIHNVLRRQVSQYSPMLCLNRSVFFQPTSFTVRHRIMTKRLLLKKSKRLKLSFIVPKQFYFVRLTRFFRDSACKVG